MTERIADDRHLDTTGLTEYLSSGAPAIVPIDGAPRLWLVIEPDEERLAVRAPLDASELPDLSGYKYLGLSAGRNRDEDWIEFGVYGSENLVEAYPVLRSVADRIQLGGATVGSAVDEVLGTYHQILSSLGRLTEQQEIGLFGELLVLDHLLTTVGEIEALQSWRGPTSEEHDFGLNSIDVEVKTTISEERAHRIASMTQLVPNVGRDLWLVSVQLTTGGLAARSLSEVIIALDQRLTTPEARRAFDATLRSLGWDPNQAELYTRRFARRGEVLAFRIDDRFPSITPARLTAGGVPIDRVRALSYILVLSGLVDDEPPEALAGIGEGT